MSIHPLFHLVSHNTDEAERATMFKITDELVPEVRALMERKATEIMANYERDSLFAKDVIMEVMIRELVNLFCLSDFFEDEVVRPHQLTKEHARAWLLPGGWSEPS